MILPKIDLPVYTIELPVSKQELKFRPYTVKEQKLLMMATESDEESTLVDTILQVATNCVISDINVSELPVTDVEFLFYQLRARSESELVHLKYQCKKKINENICGHVLNHDLNLLTDLTVSEVYDSTIQITDKIGIKLKHQTFKVDVLGDKTPSPEELFSIISDNIDFIYDEVSTYQISEIPKTAVVEFLSQLSTSQYKKVEDFFANEPKIYKELSITCPKCGTVHNIKVEDIFDFFY